MKIILAYMSAFLGVMAAAEKNWFLVIYWLMVEVYWFVNHYKKRGE